MTIDKRYKITQRDVDAMRKLRADGNTYASIGKQFGVTDGTALYWCDEKQRNKQRLKNAKRTRTVEERKLILERSNERRRKLLKENKKYKTRHIIESAKNDKTRCRKTVMNSYTGKRMKMNDAIKLLKSKEYCLSNAKIT